MKQTEKRQLFKKQVCMALAILLAVTVAMPQSVQAAISAPPSLTYYDDGAEYISFSVDGLGKNQEVKKSSVKSSNTGVATLYYLSKHSSKSQTSSFVGEEDSKYESYSATISLDVKKPGSTVISYKIGSKTYKTKITIKPYVNPVSSVTMTGVNGGKNFASLTNKRDYASVSLTKASKNAVVKVKPKSGWKVRSITVSDEKTGDYHEVYNYGSKGVSNATLQVPTFSGGSIHVSCLDKNGNSLDVSYSTGY